jgi:hypothetical protein
MIRIPEMARGPQKVTLFIQCLVDGPYSEVG